MSDVGVVASGVTPRYLFLFIDAQLSIRFLQLFRRIEEKKVYCSVQVISILIILGIFLQRSTARYIRCDYFIDSYDIRLYMILVDVFSLSKKAVFVVRN